MPTKDQTLNYYPGRVTRSDAGGELYAPVRYVNNVAQESGDTPSYDHEAVRRRCEELNAARWAQEG